jgi:lysozyme
MATVNGFDVSHHNGSVDWAGAAAGGMQFAYAKATEGATVTDSKFAENWSAMREAGVVRGAYHFFHPATDPVLQANHFLTVMGPLLPGDLPPALDLEETSQTSDEWPTIPAGSRLALVQQWIDAVETATGMKPVIYTRSGWIKQFLTDAAALADYPLWIADYKVHDTPVIPPQWSTWAFWQFSASGTVAGVSGGVDVDRFNGAIEDLKAMGNGMAGSAVT